MRFGSILFAVLACVAADDRFRLERSNDGFGTRSHGIIENIGGGRTKFYPLPQSTVDDYIRLRPEDVRINPLPRERYERLEVIGPHQWEDGKLWFGKSYYDGEGSRGVGAFGFFDTSTRQYTLYSPREIARFEVSAILVQADAVWLGLDRFGEDISASPEGLVRWDRATGNVQRLPLEFKITSIKAEGDVLRLTTPGGYALFKDGNIRRFLNSGKPIARFPPPPTHN